MTNQSDGLKDSKQAQRSQDLHREFVGMLFALAIAAVAQKAAILAVSNVNWLRLVPAYLHLILATLIITTSWIGWGASADKFSEKLKVFSKDFVELLLDLWLVVLYFIVVEGVELPVENQANPNSAFSPSLASETFWIFVMFTSYFVWDIVTKLWRGNWKRFSLRAWASFICALLSLYIFYVSPKNESFCDVIVVDISLITLVFLFRGMKLKNWNEFKRAHCVLFAIIAVFILALPLLAKYSQ